jgi:hypothetical protein
VATPTTSIGDAQVRHHLADDGQLLEVFFAEDRVLRLHQVEELAHHGGDAVEVPRPAAPAERVGEVGHPDHRVRGEAFRVHLVAVRREQVLHALGEELFAISRERPRIGVEILAGAELQRIDENADDDHIGKLASAADEFEVARMEIAHRGHEGDGFIRLPMALQGVAQGVTGRYCQHI